MTVLERIVAAKQAEVEQRKRERPVGSLENAPKRQRRSLVRALRRASRPRVIAELKKASPSRGVLRTDFDVPALAKSYADAGAAALSILTDQPFFQGDLAYLRSARQVVSVPLLRKDFILDEYQLFESLDAGADAVLLIVAILSDRQLRLLSRRAQDLDLETLVEVHSAEEAQRALETETALIGVNNRDLKSFEVSLDTSRRVAEGLKGTEALLVSESGIFGPADIAKLEAWGYEAFLIGEAFMREPDPGAALQRLREAALAAVPRP